MNAAMQPYGILQTPFAIDALQSLEAAALPKVTQKLFELQTNPRPDGHEPAEEYGKGLSSIVIQDTSPPYRLIYQVDDEVRRVVVISISQRWA
jgi:mRNA-degrading endonuclease RelE of RelBE toxin-antitoxin system